LIECNEPTAGTCRTLLIAVTYTFKREVGIAGFFNSFKKEDVDMLKKLRSEVPQFLYFLNNREITTKRESRMWFTRQQIYTPALDKVVRGNKTYLSQEIKEVLLDDFAAFELDILKYTASDLFDKINKGFRTTRFKIDKSLKEDYKLESKNGSYQKYYLSYNPDKKTALDFETKKGRYFEFRKNDFIDKVVDC
jgi:hypothetical protein